MAPRRRFDPNPPSATDRSITRSQQPTGAAARRSTSTSRVTDRRGEPGPNPVDIALGRGTTDQDAVLRWWNRQLTPAGREMMTPEPDLGTSRQLGRNYSTSMAANMDSYFNRLMSQVPPDVPETGRSTTRYPEVDYEHIDQTQQQFRENQRQAMMRTMARRIIEGGQPSTSQMLTQSYQQGFNDAPPDISEYFVDPVYGQQDRRQYPNGEQYYKAGDINTMADALAERRDLAPTALPPQILAEAWNHRAGRPFSPGVMQRYQR